MKRAFAVLLAAALFAGSARADMGAPFHTRVPTRTTVTLEQPIPGYVFYAASQWKDGYVVRLSFEHGRTVDVPHLNDRMFLAAVPAAVAERFPTVEALAEAIRGKVPDDVRIFYYDSFLNEFKLTTHRDDRLEIVVRDGPNGIEFKEAHLPRSSLSCWVVFAALAVTCFVLFLGFRWGRRVRPKPV